ncbi:MAG: tetratricopeptide repeat protein, partial [Coleofasciculus sp.]|uniref:tetratricopeptide repeat protein n=1 Tax=Coleofasciculus sp. TaxID=3100458 RepID=UPI003A12E586
AIAYYQQSLELCEQLDKQQSLASVWYGLAHCYRNRGEYEKAIECQQKDLAILQQLDDQPNIALAYYRLGLMYQNLHKYEDAITHHKQSLESYKQLDMYRIAEQTAVMVRYALLTHPTYC